MRIGFLFFPALLMAACQTPPDTAAETPQVAEGRFLAEVHCSACHAIGRGDASKHAEAPPLRELSRSYPVSALEEPLAEGIMVGHPEMPEYRFRPEDVASLVAYLESIQQR
jgi:cytochrome c